MPREHHLLLQQEKYFLNALQLVRRIARQKLHGACRQAADDIVQQVSLNLCKFKGRREEEEEEQSSPAAEGLTQEEWLKLANTAARNEITSYFRRKYRRERLFEEMPEEASDHFILFADQTAALEGNSRAEFASLLKQVWKLLETFSLRQKYAFILRNDDLIDDLISHECATLNEIAAFLELEAAEFYEIATVLPLPFEDIRHLIERKTGTTITVEQVWAAHAKARAKLAGLADLIY